MNGVEILFVSRRTKLGSLRSMKNEGSRLFNVPVQVPSADASIDTTVKTGLHRKSLFDIENSDFLDTVEAATYLRTTVASIRNATSNGKIPPTCYRKFGRRNLYLKSELRKLLLGANPKGVSDGS
jgi:hypothetical protein